MDIYQETYEQIKKKVINTCTRERWYVDSIEKFVFQVEQADKHAHPSKHEAELDMYADDFDEKEKAKLDDVNSGV